MDFEETIENLRLVQNNTIAQNCLIEMMNETILFHSGFIEKKDYLSSLYALRLDIFKKQQHIKNTRDDITSWEIAIQNLNNSSAALLKLNWFSTHNKSYMLFWNSETKNLEAIFFRYKKITIEESEKNYDETIKKGHTVSAIKYVKGIKTRTWNKS